MIIARAVITRKTIMTTEYTTSQIQEAIAYWNAQMLRESLEPKTEQKLKEMAKKFAKAIGQQIKNGGMFRLEDDQTDPLVSIKTTIKTGVSEDLCKRILKKRHDTPPELVDQIAKLYSSWFSKNLFGGDKKAISNLLKTTEQFNYFANVVLGVWHRDEEISKFLKPVPPESSEEKSDDTQDEETLDETDDLEENDAFRASGNEDAMIEDSIQNGQDDENYLDEDEMDEEDDIYENRYDRYGGYGGYGRSFSSYGSNAPRGSQISWYSVADVDPACKQMDRKWRFGPLDFTRGVSDFLYPERQYRRGATMLRYKGFQMPDGSGTVDLYVGLPSIFDAIKNNDEDALKKLDMIGICRNISLGMDPEDDYSAQYSLR